MKNYWPSLVPLAVLLGSCTGNQSVLDAQGRSAVHLAHLIWGLISLCAVIWVLVMVALGLAIWKSQERSPGNDLDTTLRQAVHMGVIATAIIVGGLTLVSFYTTRLIGSPAVGALTITVRGNNGGGR